MMASVPVVGSGGLLGEGGQGCFQQIPVQVCPLQVCDGGREKRQGALKTLERVGWGERRGAGERRSRGLLGGGAGPEGAEQRNSLEERADSEQGRL